MSFVLLALFALLGLGDLSLIFLGVFLLLIPVLLFFYGAKYFQQGRLGLAVVLFIFGVIFLGLFIVGFLFILVGIGGLVFF